MADNKDALQRILTAFKEAEEIAEGQAAQAEAAKDKDYWEKTAESARKQAEQFKAALEAETESRG